MNVDSFLLILGAAMAFGLAAVAYCREAKSPCARFAFSVGMIVLGVESLLAAASTHVFLQSAALVWQRWRLMATALLPGTWLLFSLTYARGNEKEFLTRWKTVILAAFVLPAGLAVLAWPDLVHGDSESGPNATWVLGLGRPGVLLSLISLGGAILCLMNLEWTLRSSTGTMRWRIKHMIVGLGLLFAVRCYGSTQDFLYSAVNLRLSVLNAAALLLGGGFMLLSMRRGSFGAVDLYPSHGFLRGSLTAMVAGVYLLIIGVLAKVSVYFNLGEAFPMGAFLMLLGLLGVMLIVLSDRLRQRIGSIVSRHFRRPRYDYRQIWSTFSARTGAFNEPTDYCRAVAKVISETFETLSVTVWLWDGIARKWSLGGSTSFSESEARKALGSEQTAVEAVATLRRFSHPTAVLGVPGEAGAWLKRMTHKDFAEGGECFFLPLLTNDEMLGLLILGDRVQAQPFTIEEFELLKTVADQMTANLLNIRLSRRLGDSQKLEAFQTMSAFFVHDLKNTASTLSLMLQNLPKHFDDPAFRQDAARAVSKSVDKINGLVTRLSSLRQNSEVKPVTADLNEAVKQAVANVGGFPQGALVIALGALPPVTMDAEQIQKVTTNLLINAREASGDGGKIEVRTSRNGGWVILSVSDCGCGMTAEFVERSLFRPFMTTKREGLGIGLFHSKTIVEAHHGRIEVESRPGEGSIFQVLLPVHEVGT